MQKGVNLALKMSRDLGKNWSSEIEDINLHAIFKPIYRRSENIITLNAIAAFIVFAYDNDSSWLNLKQDRLENKIKILKGLEVESDSTLLLIANNEIDSINEVIVEYLIETSTWEFKTVCTLLDYHSNMIRFVSKKTETGKSVDELDGEGNKHTLVEEYDIDTITKVNEKKGLLLEKAIEAREKADVLLAKIRKDFVQMDHAVQSDFGFSPTEEKRIDPESWRMWVRHRLIPEREAKKSKTAEG